MASRLETGSAGYSCDTITYKGHKSAGSRATQNVDESPHDFDGQGQSYQEYTQHDSMYRKCKHSLIV